MSRPRSYSDADLAAAIARSRSWRGVLRELGLVATSSSAMRSVRRRADELGVDYGHFSGQRRWTEQQLREAVGAAASWAQVPGLLGMADESSKTTLRGHAIRLGIDISGLEPAKPPPSGVVTMTPDPANLRRAAPLSAAAWFLLCGHDVSWPLEPARYDLLVDIDGALRRVQVKSTTVRAGTSWTAWLSTTRRGRTTYDVDEIDFFFVIAGDHSAYLIPSTVVGGLHAIQLSAYDAYRIRAAASSA
jgi:hypothetical protein